MACHGDGTVSVPCTTASRATSSPSCYSPAVTSDSPWLYELRRRAPDGNLRGSPDDLFVAETPNFAKAFQDREWYYLVGLSNGHVWHCSGLRLANTEGEVVRLLSPELIHPPVHANLLSSADVLLSEIAWVADSAVQPP